MKKINKKVIAVVMAFAISVSVMGVMASAITYNFGPATGSLDLFGNTAIAATMSNDPFWVGRVTVSAVVIRNSPYELIDGDEAQGNSTASLSITVPKGCRVTSVHEAYSTSGVVLGGCSLTLSN